MQQRREEILAKKAKLAELKRQRELRASQGARQSIGISSEVYLEPPPSVIMTNDKTDTLFSSYLPRRQAEPTVGAILKT